MRSILTAVLLFPIAWMASACVTDQPESKSQPTSMIRTSSLPRALNGITRVALHPRGRLVRVEDDKRVASLRSSMDSAVLDQFQSKGYVIVPASRAQVLIAYAVGVTGELEDADLQRAFGVTAGMNLGDGARRGAIVLALFDQRTEQSTWRASASAAAEITDNAERDRSIVKAISALLQGLPHAY